MRILHLIDSLGYGGAETLLMSYVPLLDNYEHVIVTLKGPNSFKKANYEYIGLNHRPARGVFKDVLAIRKIIAEKKIDIVHSHSFWTNIISRLATPGKIKLINHYHFADYDTMKHKTSVKRMILMDKLINPKTLVRVAVSEYLAKILSDTFPKATIKMLPNFVDRISVTEKNSSVAAEGLKVVAVGNCNLEKNYAFVLQVFEAIKEEPITIDIIGGGDRLDFWRNEVKRLDLNKVSFCGVDRNVRRRLNNYDLFLSASVSETFGIAVLEAVCAKLPLLISGIPAFKEIAPKGSYFFNPYDKNDLISKLRYFLNNRSAVDYTDYERTLQKYSAKNFISGLNNLYNNTEETCVA